MRLQYPRFSAGCDIGVKPDSALLSSLSPSQLGIQLRMFDLPAAADSVLAWKKEWAVGAAANQTFLFDNLPLLNINDAVVRNANGLPVTFTGLYLVHIRLEVMDPAQASAGTVAITGAAFPCDITAELDTGDLLLGELETVRSVTSGSTLSLACNPMSNKRLSVLLVGVETENNEEIYS